MDQITAHRPRYWAHMGLYGPIFLISPPLSLFCFPKIQQTHSSSSFCSSRADRAGVLDFQFIVVVVGGRGNEMTSLSGLVPITKSFLSRYYDKYPFPPLSHDVSRLTDQLQELAERLQKEHPLDSGKISLLLVLSIFFFHLWFLLGCGMNPISWNSRICGTLT